MTKRNWRPLAALALIGAVMLLARPAKTDFAGIQKTFILFNGEAMDSTEHSSKWIDVRGANRIILRTWSTHGVFTGPGSGDVDSTTSDSIATFKIDWSDSVLFVAVDSLGTVVTARSTIPRTIGVHGEPYPMCADSVEFTGNYGDSSGFTQTAAYKLPYNTPLRAPASGSGRLSYIYATTPSAAATTIFGDGTIMKGYMKVKVTPVRRATSQTGLATVPSRVNGLKGLKMTATVIYRQH